MAGKPEDNAYDPDEEKTNRILVVDDNEQNLELLVAYLETMECEVDTATDGIEAYDKIEQNPPDLILLDIMMPRMSGFECCRKIKSTPQLRDIPILMVTALNAMEDIEQGVECGTDDFISKPVNRLELVTRVRNLLRVRHLKDKLDRTLEYIKRMEAPNP
jgi:two-component system cell cycle response regulator